MRLILFEAILNCSNISKDKFLEGIDFIWFNNNDKSKIKPVDYIETYYTLKDGEIATINKVNYKIQKMSTKLIL